MTIRERLSDLTEAVSERAGVALVPRERLGFLEESDQQRRMIQRDLDLLAFTALNYVGGQPQELKAVERRKLAQKSRLVWMKDPQAGAATDLMNDFTFGRGLGKPKAADPLAQKEIDDAWSDPDNEMVLTTYQSQVALGTDLSLQSNVFILVFDDGDDGKVKLGLLEHDAVEDVVRDPENRLRILYYVARHFKQEWDFDLDQQKQDYTTANPHDPKTEGKGEIRYYPHWRNLEDAMDDYEEGLRPKPPMPPTQKLGTGKVFHISVNRTSEMAFGHPTMDRVLRWYNAYNRFMDARVDIMEASAAFVMKRKIKGTPAQLEKQATQALSRRSVLGSAEGVSGGPDPASVLVENENVTHEDFNINTNAPAAAQDAQMLRAQISAATRFPQTYYGDASNSTLATATSLELPVLKAVESRQELFEAIVRFFTDRVLERAVDAGRLDPELSDDEIAAQTKNDGDTTANSTETGPTELAAAHEDQSSDEARTQRDLSYEFSMPSPLKRTVADLITAIMNVARTFDPNNTNMELSRILLGVALGEGLELADAQGAVEKIFPEGYVDPAVAAMQAQAQAPPAPPGGPGGMGEFSPTGADGQNHPDPANPYGAPMRASTPDQMGITEARLRLPKTRAAAIDELWAGHFGSIAVASPGSNGNGNGGH